MELLKTTRAHRNRYVFEETEVGEAIILMMITALATVGVSP
ncbi:MAG: hypothetical protein NTW54_07875 [Bacteroidetes bacterium]|nr:hypothetical protein [Bacteroidota bacterium]